MSRTVLIMGAAGKDFHVFNTLYRGHNDVRVVAFTATQIPGIDGRRYPAALAGPGYPGSTYTLTYDPKRDQLQGVYFQATLRQSFDVVFVRMK